MKNSEENKAYKAIAIIFVVLLGIEFVLVSLAPAEPDWVRFAVGIGYWIFICFMAVGGLLLGILYAKRKGTRQ